MTTYCVIYCRRLSAAGRPISRCIYLLVYRLCYHLRTHQRCYSRKKILLRGLQWSENPMKLRLVTSSGINLPPGYFFMLFCRLVTFFKVIFIPPPPPPPIFLPLSIRSYVITYVCFDDVRCLNRLLLIRIL